MKKRNLIAVLVLSIVTFGIYILYWMYAVRKELVAKTSNPKDIPYVSLIFAPLLLVVAALIMGLVLHDNIAVVILAFIAGTIGVLGTFIMSIFWTYRFCIVTGKVTQATDGTLLFWLWILCDIFGIGPVIILIIQNDLNRLVDSQNADHAHSAPHAATSA